MAGEPENPVLELLRGIRSEVADIKSVMATKSDLADVRSELKADINSLRADVASDLLTMQAKSDAEHEATRGLIEGLRRRVCNRGKSPGVLVDAVADRVGSACPLSENEGLYDGRAQRARLQFADARTFAPLTRMFEYHSSVIGQGMLIPELEARVRRMEKHLDLPPIGAN